MMSSRTARAWGSRAMASSFEGMSDYFLKRLSKPRRMSPGRVESGEASCSTVTRSENDVHSFRAFLSATRSWIGSAHSKRRPVSKCVHCRQAWIGTRQFGHCSSDAVAIGSTAPHAPHRETVCLASIPPLRGASDGGGGGDGRRGSPPWFRYPCCRYFRSDMRVVPLRPYSNRCGSPTG